jgi:hypothetical protein
MDAQTNDALDDLASHATGRCVLELELKRAEVAKVRAALPADYSARPQTAL